MYPILDRYGGFFLYSYTVVMAVGLAAGIGLTAWLEKRDAQDWPGWLDGLIVALLIGLIGGRAGYVIGNWTYFQEEPGQIGFMWRGGLNYHGALLAGLLGLMGWSVWKGYSFTRYVGLLAPALVLVSAFGWLACWFEGCAFGLETTFGPLAGDLPDSYGVFGLRYQTQLLGTALCLFFFPIIVASRSRLRPGLLFVLTLFLLSASRTAITLLRGDKVPVVGSVRWDTVLDGAMAAVALLILVIAALWHSIYTRRQLP